MKIRVKNNRDAPYGIEVASGGYRFLAKGEERTLTVPPGFRTKDFLDVTIISDLPKPPASLKAKARDVGKVEHDPAFSGFLDRSVPAIEADFAKASTDDLNAHLVAERGGKSRKTLIAALEAEIEARSQ